MSPRDAAASLLSGSLKAGLPAGVQAEELVETLAADSLESLAEQPRIRIERIVSTGQVTPPGEWYDQAWDEFVLLVSGAANLRIEDEPDDRQLAPGDWVLLPARCRHRVTWTQSEPPTIWLCVHYGVALEGG